MSIQYPQQQARILYQADPDVATNLWAIRDRIRHICKTYANQWVRVQTLDGHTYEGVIVQCDNGHVYLRCVHPSGERSFFGPSPFGPGPFFGPSPLQGLSSYYADQAILTLVLFELLVIVLLA